MFVLLIVVNGSFIESFIKTLQNCLRLKIAFIKLCNIFIQKKKKKKTECLILKFTFFDSFSYFLCFCVAAFFEGILKIR